METIIQQVHPGGMVSGRRIVALFAALALVLGGVVLATDKAEAAPSAAVAVAADEGAVASVGSALQVDVGALIRAIVCPILTRLANGPFGAFIGATIAALRARFGCVS